MQVSNVRVGFEQTILDLRLDKVLPHKQVPEALKTSARYKRIAQSIAEIGLIEPLVVTREASDNGSRLLLDGHARRAILLDLGETEARCILALDDEAFTYNKRINHLATIQEHFMIVRALEKGVPEEKLARALDVNIGHIKRRRTLLDGVCPEVIEMLKDRFVNPSTFGVLKKMKPMRQIEAAELMHSVSNFSSSYAKALLAATKQSDLARPERPKKISGMTPEQMARMEREMETLQRDFKAVESSYGEDVLHLVIASGYLSKLVANEKIEKYLASSSPEILEKFRAIISSASLESQSTTAGLS
ncbi:plasmid partitioning protein RepB C-terminal domain-containing protein [Bradyrhizobium sp. SYSU BS000235]|uniref:plasmid partitioning protein RepB C-terminal domain-containing protein n=1 Tax=Bradyrhizobium sp. SYSU BS000235 TaxID=3411332 RepID=UPI003C71EDE8